MAQQQPALATFSSNVLSLLIHKFGKVVKLHVYNKLDEISCTQLSSIEVGYRMVQEDKGFSNDLSRAPARCSRLWYGNAALRFADGLRLRANREPPIRSSWACTNDHYAQHFCAEEKYSGTIAPKRWCRNAIQRFCFLPSEMKPAHMLRSYRGQ